MKPKRPARPPKKAPQRTVERPDAADAADAADATDADGGAGRIVARPDGYHWIAPDGKQEFGPFETIEDARAEMEASDEVADPPASAVLHDAENNIGIADWIDPETGEPAEGQSPPHLDED